VFKKSFVWEGEGGASEATLALGKINSRHGFADFKPFNYFLSNLSVKFFCFALLVEERLVCIRSSTRSLCHYLFIYPIRVKDFDIISVTNLTLTCHFGHFLCHSTPLPCRVTQLVKNDPLILKEYFIICVTLHTHF